MADRSRNCALDAHIDCLGATETSRMCGCPCHLHCPCGAELVTEQEVFTGDCAACARTLTDYPGF